MFGDAPERPFVVVTPCGQGGGMKNFGPHFGWWFDLPRRAIRFAGAITASRGLTQEQPENAGDQMARQDNARVTTSDSRNALRLNLQRQTQQLRTIRERQDRQGSGSERPTGR